MPADGKYGAGCRSTTGSDCVGPDETVVGYSGDPRRREPLRDGAVQVLERDERLVNEPTGVVDRGERERPVEGGGAPVLGDREYAGLDRDAGLRVMGSEGCDHSTVATYLVLEERAIESGGG